ncbi:MAG TPA: hypothetical protein PKH65_05525 [Bacteroidia bacterium]|nr:hypothetical protein [Bacteroidia bacterium]HNT80122.1 hypothetical protein [Bacteroidia bacterium]
MANVALSNDETTCLENKEFFILKKNIGIKLNNLLESFISKMNDLSNENELLLELLEKESAKISRGENYLNFPYWVLDYPRCFYGKDVMACRTMIWWGNEISFTIHISGLFKEKYLYQIKSLLASEVSNHYWCINQHPWEYHFNENNSVLLNSLSTQYIEQHLKEKDFVKISQKISLNEYEKMINVGIKFYNSFFCAL